jgi:regulator of RNase E activity RraA
MEQTISSSAISDQERNWIRALLQLSTGNVADALCLNDHPPVVIPGLRSFGASRRFAGPIFTLEQGRRYRGIRSGNLTRHVEAIDNLAAPGEVILISTAGDLEVCTLGALLLQRCKVRGLAGVVVYGCVRDVEECSEVDLPLLATGTSPLSSTYVYETTHVNAPLTLPNGTVHPGDIAFGDATGAIVFPRQYLEIAASGGEAVARRETEWAEAIPQGISLSALRAGSK